jgi:hypothetical protein
MPMSEFLQHVLNICSGVSADVTCFGLFYFAGRGLLTLTTRSRRSTPSQTRTTPIPSDGFAVVLVTALYGLWCWYGIQAGIGLFSLVWIFWAFVLTCACFGWRHIVEWATGPAGIRREILGSLAAFVLFYAVAYSFFTPTVTGRDLPLVSYVNNDILNYLNFTRALQDLRSSNVAGLSFVTSPTYFQTPAAFYLLGLLATFFRMDPMHAAMPALFGLCALLGLLAARISRAVFSVSRFWGIAIGATLISGPFFRYVAGNYFLSTLIALPIVVHLIWTTTEPPVRGRDGVVSLALRYGAHYVLLLLVYPVLLAIALAAQASICAARVATSVVSRTRGAAKSDGSRNGMKEAVAALIGVGLTIAAAPQHVLAGVQTLRYLSQAGVAGWPLDFISPLALVGFPGAVNALEIRNVNHPQFVMALFGGVLLFLIGAYFWWFRSSTTRAERDWVGIGVGSLVVYWIAFLVLGRSYQQWRLASYLPLPLSFALIAATLRLGTLVAERAMRLRDAVRRGVSVTLAVSVAWFFVGGNQTVHASGDEPPLRRFPASLANLAEIDHLPFFREMYVEMGGAGATFMPVYFIRHKELHLLSESYYPIETLSLDRVSRTWPYFTQDFECDSVGHSNVMTIAGVGCLLFDPPSPQLDVSYPFGRSFMFIRPLAGFDDQEPGGRWSEARVVQLEVEADALHVPINASTLYLNLLLDPYIPAKAPPQHLLFSWGKDRGGTVELAAREWVSLPVQASDWKGERVRTVSIRLDLPGALAFPPGGTPPDQSERAVAFNDLTLSMRPQGRPID